ncbi:MAG TPA: hypothetical protein ENI22_02545 [Candidatus Pacearchaeota archaeon]|nr:hypothetical protein [Candidatus Pacearchaeota archaeon]
MPINRKDFDNGKFQTRHDNRDTHPIAVLLKKNNASLAFTVKEIIKATKMKEDSVRSMLRNFEEAGLIVHKTPFFAWKEVQKRNKPKRRR